MLAGIRDILIISTPHDLPRFRQLLGDGAQWGMKLQYAEQPSPDGLAQAFIIGREFIGGQPRRAGARRQHLLRARLRRACCGAPTRDAAARRVFGYHVNDPERYGVVEFDDARPGASASRRSRAAAVALTR